MKYTITDHDGTVYGPVGAAELREWGEEGRLDATVTIRDEQLEGTFPGTSWQQLAATGLQKTSASSEARPHPVIVPDIFFTISVGVLSVLMVLPPLFSGGVMTLTSLIQMALTIYACVLMASGRKAGFIIVMVLFALAFIPNATSEYLANLLAPSDSDVVTSPGTASNLFPFWRQSSDATVIKLRMINEIAYFFQVAKLLAVSYAACRVFRAYGPELT